MTQPQDDPDEMRERVARSRAAQGLPPTIEDLAVIERVARVFELIEPRPIEASTVARLTS
ncbi:hypothetical protein LO772_20720 [Yinghuangia sp. ASG 101]|uniref:hypothetical protein n=1 Tax=Yinghuangia sp. ASG 101 TaxID=2896848 RepID=UPI001E63AEDF|nr:hypothetical protein [Yinghuangia sp. ASG 101]UGQ09358.1 hypothetical protein LO772_20720 [Yinghuangia sp. ASG 101]